MKAYFKFSRHSALLFLLFFIFSVKLSAQNVGINSSGATPDASAGLDIDFADKGILIPRVALTGLTDVATIATAGNSLLVYNTATAGSIPNKVFPGYYFWDDINTIWKRLINGGTIVGPTADVANSTTTLADITGLSFPVESGFTYKFKFFITYNSAATTTGARWTINTAATVTNLRFNVQANTTASATTFVNGLTAVNTGTTTTASLTGNNNIAIIEGIIKTSTSGTVIGRFFSEVSTSAITVKAGLCYVSYEIIE